MIEIFLAVFVGVLAGTVTGLFPGVHINLVAAGILASVGYFSGLPVLALVVFIVAMAVTHTFIDFIPSVFLGAPEEDSFLSVLPGHQMLKDGRGHEAVILTLYGSLVALAVVILFAFIFVLFLPGIYNSIRVVIPYILIFISLYLVFREDDFVLAGVVFVMAGFLGLFSFNLPVREPLLPLLSGLFGVSGLLVSLSSREKIPKQVVCRLREVKFERSGFLKNVLAGSVAAPLASFLPGMGSGHAAVMASEMTGSFGRDRKEFLFLVGLINTVVMGVSFVTIYSIGRTRTGAAVAVSELLGEFGIWELVIILGVVVVSGVAAFFIGTWISKIFALKIGQINYQRLSYGIIFILVLVNLVLSNFLGVVVLITSSALGVFCIMSGARRINLMGCLLVPTIIFYLVG